MEILALIFINIIFFFIAVLVLRWALRINDIVTRLEHISMSNQKIYEVLGNIRSILIKNNSPQNNSDNEWWLKNNPNNKAIDAHDWSMKELRWNASLFTLQIIFSRCSKAISKGSDLFFHPFDKKCQFPPRPFHYFFDIFIGRLQLMLRNMVRYLCDFYIEITEERKALLTICYYASFPFFSLCKNPLSGK